MPAYINIPLSQYLELTAKNPFPPLQPAKGTNLTGLDTLKPVQTEIDWLSFTFGADGVNEENKHELSKHVFYTLREWHLSGYTLSRPSHTERDDSSTGYHRLLRISRPGCKRVADIAFSPWHKGAQFYRLEINPAHITPEDFLAIRELLEFLEFGCSANFASSRVTRHDFAADFDCPISDLALKRSQVKKYTSEWDSKMGVGTEAVYCLEGGYLGSPKSSRYVRVYEKSDGLTRFELVRRTDDEDKPHEMRLDTAVDHKFFKSMRIYAMQDILDILPDLHPRHRIGAASGIKEYGLAGYLKMMGLTEAEEKAINRKLAKTPQLWDSNAMIERATDQTRAVVSQLFDDAGAGHTLH